MIKLTKNWYNLLQDEFSKPYFKALLEKLNEEYLQHTIYPPYEKVFSALNYVKFNDVKVVIIGQDPYHEPNQAMGMSFSVPNGVKIPPSLVNIYKEIESELGIKCQNTGDLTRWAKQGVLLLNTTLTVRQGQANSHKNLGWETFTTQIIKLLNTRQKPIVFVLWGNNAKVFEQYITNPNHCVLKSAHPSPLSAYNGFFGNGHFKKANQFLISVGETPINWQ